QAAIVCQRDRGSGGPCPHREPGATGPGAARPLAPPRGNVVEAGLAQVEDLVQEQVALLLRPGLKPTRAGRAVKWPRPFGWDQRRHRLAPSHEKKIVWVVLPGGPPHGQGRVTDVSEEDAGHQRLSGRQVGPVQADGHLDTAGWAAP